MDLRPNAREVRTIPHHPYLIIYNNLNILHSTHTSSSGLKTRHFGAIIGELTASLRIHAENGSALGGVSLEFTGEFNEAGYSVTECLGGSMELTEEELGLRYQVCIFFSTLEPLGSGIDD